MSRITRFRKLTGRIAEEIFKAKVDGTRIINELFHATKLDFCLHVSSLHQSWAGLGLVAYSAANLFMDAFNQKSGSNDWQSINWRVGAADESIQVSSLKPQQPVSP